MFTLDAIRKKAQEASFLRGKAYYFNKRIRNIDVKKMGNSIYEIHGIVRGTKYYKTIVSIDTVNNKLINWKCSCPYDYGGICKHTVAISMSFLYDIYNKSSLGVSDDTSKDMPISALKNMNINSNNSSGSNPSVLLEKNYDSWIDQSLEKAIFKDLGLMEYRSSRNTDLTNKYTIIFNEFNIDGSISKDAETNQTQAARSRRFSLKVLYGNNRGFNGTGIRLDRDMIKIAPGAYSLFLEHIITNGVYVDGYYYLGQLNIDTVFSFAAELDEVLYSNDDISYKLEFVNTRYKPEIEIALKSDGSTDLSFEKDILIIPGKYSVFILKDHKIMKLMDNVPWSFISKVESKPSIGLEYYGKLINSVVPVLKDTFNIVKTKKYDENNLDKNNGQHKPVNIITKDIKPEVHIYVKYGKDNERIYISPEIQYDDYLSINPFTSIEIKEHENIFNFILEKSVFTVESVKTNNEIIQFRRNNLKEHQVYTYFNNFDLFEPDEDGRLEVDDSTLYYLFNNVIPGIPEDWKIFYDKGIEKIKFQKQEITCNFDFLVESDNNLLEFDLEFHCGNLKISMEQLENYIDTNKKLLNIGGNFIEITNKEELSKLFSLLENFNEKGNSRKYSGKLYQAIEIDELIENANYFSYKGNENYINLINQSRNYKLVDEVLIPEKFRNILRDYQIDGIRWMYFLRKYGFGGVLADDMGLGKTLQVLVMLSMVASESSCTKIVKKTSLIICPKTLIHNWHNEIKKFVPNLKVLIACGGSSERITKIQKAKYYDIVITSYPLIQKDIDAYNDIEFEYCILDEAQYIKNPITRTAKSVKAIKCKYRLALTGTPMENTLVDLWSIFDFVMPGFLGSETWFKSTYGNINVENRSAFSGDNNSGLSALNKKIKPFILRRHKEEMLKDLPPKIEQVSYSDLKTEQLALYTKMLEKIRGDLFETVAKKGFNSSQIEILAGLTRLRQICNHPGLLNEKFIDAENISGKLDLFDELLNKCIKENHRILVFSQFVKMLNILENMLNSKKIPYCRLDGQSKNREKIINDFNSDETKKVFLISLKAGGFGLNLTSADTVILFDPWWNPMVEEQASDRVHRIGQNKTVNVYKLITKGTVEEKIQKLQERKKVLFDSVVNESGDVFKKLTWEDLKDILET